MARSSHSASKSGSESDTSISSSGSGSSSSSSSSSSSKSSSRSVFRSNFRSNDHFDAQDRLIKKLGKSVTHLMKKVEVIEATLNEVAVLYKFVDEKVFSLNDRVYFIIKKRITISELNAIRPYKKITKFFRNLIERVYGNEEIRKSDARKNPPTEMRKCCKIAMSLWNEGTECFPKIYTSQADAYEKQLWDIYLRVKHELTQ